MHKIKRYIVALVLLMEILTVITSPALKVTAVTKIVAPGNSFVYGRSDGKPWLWSDPPSAPVRAEWKQFVNLSTIDFKIIPNPIPDSNVISFNRTIAFENQSVKEFQGSINLNTAEGEGYVFFISAELGAGQRIYPNPVNENYTWIINETRIDPNWGGREICFYNHTRVGWEQQGMLSYISTIILWDRLTGVLLSVYEARGSAIGFSGGPAAVSGIVFYELISNNIGIPVQHSGTAEMTPIYIVVAVVLVAALVILIVRLSTSKPKKKWKRLKD